MARLNRFTWYELNTSDIDAATRFYAATLGWGTQKWEGGMEYTMWTSPSGPFGGVLQLSAEAKAMGAPPHWMGYISVANAADIAERVRALGGQVYVPPTDLPNNSRFAIFADPQGAAFAVHQSGSDEPDPQRGLGDFGWAELASSDPDAGFAFYAELFGWVKTGAMDMGEMGSYLMFGPSAEGASLGGMMRRPKEMPMSAWLHYVNVGDVDAVAKKVTDQGGRLIYPPQDIPGGRITACIDPQGAAFALHAEKK